MTRYKIKQLEWDKSISSMCDRWINLNGFTGYIDYECEAYVLRIKRKENHLKGKIFDTLEAAKEAAQKHYENEVKKHLEEV